MKRPATLSVFVVLLLTLLALGGLLLSNLNTDNATVPPPDATTAPPLGNTAEHPTLMAIDALLAQLNWANVVFSAPANMTLQQTYEVTFLMSVAESVAELKNRLAADSNVRSDTIRVSDIMDVNLVGPNFEITPITPQQQPVSGISSNEWRWEVSPKRTGQVKLYLTVNAILTIDGQGNNKVLRTFTKNIDVDVSPQQHVANFITTHWQWLFTAIIIPLVIYLWSEKQRKKKQQAETR